MSLKKSISLRGMKKTHSAGGVIVNGEGNVAIVNQRGKSWSLPKGHHEGDEIDIETAQREIYEETGLKELVLLEKLGSYNRPKLDSENHDNKKEMKRITLFLFTTKEKKLKPHDADEQEARWIAIDEVENWLTHPKDKAFFKKIKQEVKRRTHLNRK